MATSLNQKLMVGAIVAGISWLSVTSRTQQELDNYIPAGIANALPAGATGAAAVGITAVLAMYIADYIR